MTEQAGLMRAWQLVSTLILRPKEGWPAIASAPLSTAVLMGGVAAPLVTMGTLAAVIGGVYVGIPLPDGSVEHATWERALSGAAASLALTLASVWVMALLIEALAPRFEGSPDRAAAVKLAVYSSTPTWIAALGLIYPPIAVLTSIFGLYSWFLFWWGVPVLVKPNPQRQGLFAIAIIGLMFLLTLVTMAAAGGAQ